MQSVLDERDSVVVLPTGGGKSLCFQAPAVAMPGLAIVVSPLIALMKDQVDGLTDCGVPAACINSTLSPDERRNVAGKIRSGELKLLYLSPERLMTEATLALSKLIGTFRVSVRWRRRRQTSAPDTLGSIQSRRTRSGRRSSVTPA